MLNTEILDTPDLPGWDERVLSCGGSIYQTTSYAEYMNLSLGFSNYYILVKDGETIVGQVIIHSGPRFAKYLKGRREGLYKFFSKYFKVYNIIKGPVILKSELKKDIYIALLDCIDNLAKKDHVFMIQDFSLPIGESSEVYPLFLDKKFCSDDWGTVALDVTKSEEELWSALQKTRRNVVRRGQNQGLQVKEAKSIDDYAKVIKIIKNMSKRNDVFAHPDEYYHCLFKTLGSKGLLKTFFIEKDGNGVATVSVYVFGKQVIQTLVAHTDYSIQEKISGVDFLEWFLIKWSHDNGYATYDLAGVRPKSIDPKDISLREFKMRWGGQVLEYPYFSKYYSKPKAFILNKLKDFFKSKKIGI